MPWQNAFGDVYGRHENREGKDAELYLKRQSSFYNGKWGNCPIKSKFLHITGLLFYVNRLIIAPLNRSSFAKSIYKFSKQNPGQISPTSVRFIEGLDSREDMLLRRALGFIYLSSSPLLHHDVEFRSRNTYLPGHLLWFGQSNCSNGFFDTQREVETLMELDLLQYSPLPLTFMNASSPSQPLVLYKKDSSIALIPNQSHQFSCYKATAKAVELMLASGDTWYDQTAEVVIAEKMSAIGVAKKCVEIRVEDNGGVRRLVDGAWTNIPKFPSA